MKLSAPWITYYRELEALFAYDEEVKVVYEEETAEVKLFVDNARKADALTALLPAEKAFGNVTMKITVIPSNKEMTRADLIAEAFSGNPALGYIQHVETLVGSFDYAVFEPKVVQFFNDNMQDLNGLKSTLYEDIARDVFTESDETVFFCTRPVDRDLAKPLGEWP